MATDEGDDDIPVLSAYALAALQEFYDEQITKQECVNTVQEDWVKLLLAQSCIHTCMAATAATPKIGKLQSQNHYV